MTGNARVAVISTVHDTYDNRIYYKQLAALRQHFDVRYFTPLAQTPDEPWIVPLNKGTGKLARVMTHLSLVRRLPSWRADLYLLHDPELLPLGLALRLFGRRVIWDMHEDTANDIMTKTYLSSPLRWLMSRLYRAIQDLSARTLDGFILAEDSYTEQFPVDVRTCVVHNYPVLQRLQAHCNSAKTPRSLVYIGSISRNRGIFQLLDIVTEIRRHFADVRLRLIGPFTDAVLERDVRQLIATRGLETNVEILGAIRNADALPLVAQSMIGLALLLPEPNFERSLPTKMFEYMGLGLPVAVSNFPLWRDIVVGTDSGVALDPFDTSGASAVLMDILSDDARYEVLAANAARAAENYSWDSEQERFIAFLEERLAA